MPYYDDNFGDWDGMDPGDPDFEENQRFYQQVQEESVSKECCDCGRIVMLRPDYCRCNSCADIMERTGGY